jgi:hypothetical protein
VRSGWRASTGEHVTDGLALKRLPAGEHFVEHHAEREHVAPVIPAHAARLLRRHVRGGAENRAGLRTLGAVALAKVAHGRQRRRIREARGRLDRAVLVTGLRQPEVQHFDLVVRCDLDVRGLEIAVNNALFVRRFERFRQLTRDVHGGNRRHGPGRQHLAQRLARDQLHHQEMAPLSFLQAEECRDAGMIERRQHSSFALEAQNAIAIGEKHIADDLDGDIAAEPGVAGAINGSHPAFAQPGHHFVRTELLANHDRRQS